MPSAGTAKLFVAVEFSLFQINSSTYPPLVNHCEGVLDIDNGPQLVVFTRGVAWGWSESYMGFIGGFYDCVFPFFLLFFSHFVEGLLINHLWDQIQSIQYSNQIELAFLTENSRLMAHNFEFTTTVKSTLHLAHFARLETSTTEVQLI